MVMLQGYLVGIDSCFNSRCFNIPLIVSSFCKKRQNTIIVLFSKIITMDLELAPFRITQRYSLNDEPFYVFSVRRPSLC